MGVHVTLTGLRGGVAPPLGVLAYMGLEAGHAGAGEFALLLPLVLTFIGLLGFKRMGRRGDAQQAAPQPAGTTDQRDQRTGTAGGTP
jgi:hypothetical protein